MAPDGSTVQRLLGAGVGVFGDRHMRDQRLGGNTRPGSLQGLNDSHGQISPHDLPDPDEGASDLDLYHPIG